MLNCPNLMVQKKAGFSLVEVVVAMTIVIVLAALLIAGYRAATSAAAVPQCASRLRHIYTATLQYVQDHDGLMYPDNGPRTDVRLDYNFNQWWWCQAYLGRYALGDLSRRRDNGGRITQEEAEIFNCPNRFVDGPDSEYAQANGTAAVSYVMRRQVTANSINNPGYRIDFQFYNINEPSRQLLITEGRFRIVPASGVLSGEKNDSSRRLRRYHSGALNILFYDGHIELFSGTDERLRQEYWQPLRP